MRPLFQVITVNFGPEKLVAINYFDENGAHADQHIGAVGDDEELALIDAVLGTVHVHKLDTVDIETDNDTLFKLFLAVPGVNVSLTSRHNLSALYRQFEPDSPIYPILAELYEPEEEEGAEDTEEPMPENPNRWARIINFIRGVFKQ
ncbi:hypothetical protein [Paenibacillus aceti]|uniref:Uncharacterized protein n=1 Tax=Paenibacillus aceti TaxID=1820010 RepID=A0ABQ1W145_9BACL|nr:hypothetical protein [Paenibacillus aceti]GGG08683.1 hypothetical protein GCM10010913_33050 [Paenibacillus aceti]